jgi:hypothetical protein
VYKANLIAVTPAGSVPDDLRPFIDFKASLKGIQLKRTQLIAIFQVETTECYIPVFLDKGMKVQDVKDELATQEAEMNNATEKVIENGLANMTSEKKK